MKFVLECKSYILVQVLTNMFFNLRNQKYSFLWYYLSFLIFYLANSEHTKIIYFYLTVSLFIKKEANLFKKNKKSF